MDQNILLKISFIFCQNVGLDIPNRTSFSSEKSNSQISAPLLPSQVYSTFTLIGLRLFSFSIAESGMKTPCFIFSVKTSSLPLTAVSIAVAAKNVPNCRTSAPKPLVESPVSLLIRAWTLKWRSETRTIQFSVLILVFVYRC